VARPAIAQGSDTKAAFVTATGAAHRDHVPAPQIGEPDRIAWRYVPFLFHDRSLPRAGGADKSRQA